MLRGRIAYRTEVLDREQEERALSTMTETIVWPKKTRDAFWDGGAQVFINWGVNGRWAETLTQEEVAEYEARAVGELGPECARWLATGEGL